MCHLKFNRMCNEKFRKLLGAIKSRWERLGPIRRLFGGAGEVVFYTTLPTFIVLLSMFIEIDSNVGIEQLYVHGEFLLYSIALLSSSYTTMKVYGNQNTSVVVILIIATSILYSITVKAGLYGIKECNLLWSSVAVFVVGCGFTIHAMKLKSKEGYPHHDRDIEASNKIQEKLNYGENK